MIPKGRPADVSSPLASFKTENSVALIKFGTDIVKTTPAGEYLTSALNDFDLEQYGSLAAISDGANKLLMLVSVTENIFLNPTAELKSFKFGSFILLLFGIPFINLVANCFLLC